MKKIKFLLICYLLINISGFSQKGSVMDSLKSLLRDPSPIQKVDVLNCLSRQSKSENTSDAFRYAYEALHVAEKVNYSKGKVQSIQILAELNLISHNENEAINMANMGMSLAKALNDTFSIARFNLLKASILKEQNEKIQVSLKDDNIHQQRLILIGIVIIVLLFSVVIIVIIRTRLKIRKANMSLEEFSQQIQQKATALQQANESKDKFLSIISHDLKNPISAVTGLSDLLLDPSLEMTDEEKNTYIKYINEGCISADHLLENLMKWVRSQTGKMEMKPLEFDLSQPVNDAITLVQNAAVRKKISISSSITNGTLVYADNEMINTCFINLLSNAVKFTPIEGNIQIKSEVNSEEVYVHVTDSGVGISPENIQKLFRPDIKSGTLGTANEKGTGLGLILVKEFIEKNKGTISVQSTIDKGSTFTLTLPFKVSRET